MLWLTKKKIDFALRLYKNTKIRSRYKKYQHGDLICSITVLKDISFKAPWDKSIPRHQSLGYLTEYIDSRSFDSIHQDVDEIAKILFSNVKCSMIND